MWWMMAEGKNPATLEDPHVGGLRSRTRASIFQRSIADLDNVVITPHIGSAAVVARRRTMLLAG
jgi:lactate dehydrogenase-like 2-hydroxyacid dehydrogenase